MNSPCSGSPELLDELTLVIEGGRETRIREAGGIVLVVARPSGRTDTEFVLALTGEVSIPTDRLEVRALRDGAVVYSYLLSELAETPKCLEGVEPTRVLSTGQVVLGPKPLEIRIAEVQS